jgi:hypothetical protein
MPWIEPISTAVTAAELARKLAEGSGALRRYVERFKYWAQYGDAKIAIVGASGTGKTKLAKIMTADQDPFHLEPVYKTSLNEEELHLPADVPGQVYVVPGQIDYVESTRQFNMRYGGHWNSMLRRIENDEFLGVIHVVSYGFHSFSDYSSYKEHDIGQGKTPAQFMEEYSTFRRRAEIAVLRLVLGSLAKIKRSTWLITVVSKQDLWWTGKAAVRKFYEQGEYSRFVRETQTQLRSRNVDLQHEIIPVSLIISNMHTLSEFLILNSSGYDTDFHILYIENLLNSLTSLISKGPSQV